MYDIQNAYIEEEKLNKENRQNNINENIAQRIEFDSLNNQKIIVLSDDESEEVQVSSKETAAFPIRKSKPQYNIDLSEFNRRETVKCSVL